LAPQILHLFFKQFKHNILKTFLKQRFRKREQKFFQRDPLASHKKFFLRQETVLRIRQSLVFSCYVPWV
jgi:hypothetical protein